MTSRSRMEQTITTTTTTSNSNTGSDNNNKRKKHDDNNNNTPVTIDTSKMNLVHASDPNAIMAYKHQNVLDHLEKYYGKDHMNAIRKAQVRPPTFTTIRVNTSKCDRPHLLNQLRPYFESIQFKLQDNNIIPFSNLVKEDTNETIQSITNQTILLKNHGPFNPQPKYKQVVVGVLCAEAVLRGSDIFAPGIIGSFKHIVEGDMVSVFVDLSQDGKRGFIIDGYYAERTVFVGNGVSLMNRLDYYSTRGGVGIKMTERIWDCPPLNGVLTDKLFLQHLPSILTVFQMDLLPSQREKRSFNILDMCAAPGGKTTLIASLVKNNGLGDKITAIDKNKKKAKMVSDLCRVNGFDENGLVTVRAGDSKKLLIEGVFKEESFDRILLDGPCSGLGTRPRFDEATLLIDLDNSACLQRVLIDAAVKLLAPGGILVYSTCTINPCENEENVKYLLDNYGSFMQLVPQTGHIGDPGLPGILPENLSPLVQRFDPSTNHETIGFFISKFKKTASSQSK
ncbi:NOL1/NOP2/Sun family protein [Cavenderia fasciculata]|uniref:NOL1/NOP2/Sun family protein n=1 Tax=Cavenderia fasciculata TaxID=261658 RepID=F4Q520_CACFS|nr:NOL1/NOP2/Sun family protein [Cavenderia fasciculata]EGG17913.1 NOL1/NOP2/Sun family protein [Cavenderia fasciculata]|eukprot:XP_004356397.1 NOL1/NOP2/Sun family protein [Cavenderia fasciculata]